jgi:hypothetical protein
MNIKARSMNDKVMVIANKTQQRMGLTQTCKATRSEKNQGRDRYSQLSNWVEGKGRFLKDKFKVSI